MVFKFKGTDLDIFDASPLHLDEYETILIFIGRSDLLPMVYQQVGY
jgi:hypothetical protein